MAQALDDEFDGVIDGGVAIGIGVYLALVFYNGNISAFFAQVKQERGYLEFLIAAFVVYKLLEIKMTRPIIGLFVIGAFIVAAQNIIGKMDTSKFAAYSSGSIGLFELVGSIFSV